MLSGEHSSRDRRSYWVHSVVTAEAGATYASVAHCDYEPH